MSATTLPITAIEAVEYHASPGLSHSRMKDLMVSPLRFWHKHINPNRVADEPSKEMQFGTALHAAVLEPEKFNERYCCEIDADDYADLLVTMDDLRGWLKANGLPSSGKTKQELVDRVMENDPEIAILQVLEERHIQANIGKIQLSKSDWLRVIQAADALRCEPEIQKILSEDGGQAEATFFVTDPETGVPLKARMDWITAKYTLDLKTFSQQRGNSIDKSVTNAIWYEGYYRQAFFYSKLRAIQAGDKTMAGPQKAPEFVNAFVESEEPHEVRIRSLRPKSAGEVNLLWERARYEVRDAIRLYADCMEQFGEKPWRTAREIEPVADQEIPGLSFS